MFFTRVLNLADADIYNQLAKQVWVARAATRPIRHAGKFARPMPPCKSLLLNSVIALAIDSAIRRGKQKKTAVPFEKNDLASTSGSPKSGWLHSQYRITPATTLARMHGAACHQYKHDAGFKDANPFTRRYVKVCAEAPDDLVQWAKDNRPKAKVQSSQSCAPLPG